MPVLNIVCPDCRHAYRSLVVEGARVPKVWVCPKCGGRRAEVAGVISEAQHPWAGASMDACCG
ncbi:MAG: hypothetical protein OXF41_21280 [bacterium]|nr:hypothetical protein [bacterium]